METNLLTCASTHVVFYLLPHCFGAAVPLALTTTDLAEKNKASPLGEAF